MSEVINTDEWATKVDEGIEKVGDAQNQVDAWWDGLTNLEQKNPANIARHNAADRALGKAGEVLNGADQAINDGNSSTIQYSMDKQVKDMWNFIVGSQFQFSKHWMLRAEFGFLGSRTQGMVGLQYRFGL
jgi:hypothetical protein